MAYKDGEVFKTYCDKLYDRHQYKIIFKDGMSETFDDYEIMRYHWYQWREEVSTVEIVDVKKKRQRAKGF